MEGLPKLDAIAAGNVVRYLNAEWTVLEKSVRRDSGHYTETQWTLRGHFGEDSYLLKTEERKRGGVEVIWVFTRPTVLESISYESAPGAWTNFKELNMPSPAPRKVKFVNEDFFFDEETVVDAEDDDGNIVPKATWDYYSSDRKRNLAIEIWKEEDRDYPEAYDGKVVEVSAFEVLAKKASAYALGGISGSAFDAVKSSAGMFFIFGLVLVGNGVPMDFFLFLAPLVGALGIMIARRLPLQLWASSVAIWVAVALLARFSGYALSFWFLGAVCVGLSLLMPRLMAVLFSSEEPGAGWQAAVFGAFPALWCYSFLQYFVYAPGPRADYQLFAVILLPLAASGVCALLSRVSEGSNG